MKTNALLASRKGDKRYTEMAKRAAALKKQGRKAAQTLESEPVDPAPPSVRLVLCILVA